MSEYEAVIGLETHIQLNTHSKIFCSCSTDSWTDPPNSNICPICTGLPGVLPSLNRAAVDKAVTLALAVQADSVQPVSYLARKNYFYPDLPKGYQISQYDEPLAVGGHIDIPVDGDSVHVRIAKLHIEEDAGKTIREDGRRLIDFNRCGVPLVEMVTEPDLHTAEQAAQYLIRLRQLLRWLDISEGDMEKGQLRCDANVSIRPEGSVDLLTKTEIKNVNSIDAVRQAVQTEIERQIAAVEGGEVVEAWTLDWDEDTGTLRKMRIKETEADYRYFREPDLLPIEVDRVRLADLAQQMPELPLQRRARFIEEYELPPYDAEILTEERSLSEYFEQTAQAASVEPKIVSNWLMNDVMALLRERNLKAGDLTLRPGQLARILELLEASTINTPTAKELLDRVQESGRDPVAIVEEQGLAQVSDQAELERLAGRIVAENPEQVETYRGGKSGVLGWFVGQIMKETEGKANPQLAKQILQDLLEE